MTYIYVKRDVISAHTLISNLLGGEGRGDLKEGLRYGEKINHMITLGSHEFSFLTYIYYTCN